MSDENLVKQLADAMRADVNDGHWTGWEQTARAVLACGLVVPTSDALGLAQQWETDTTETWFQPEASEYAKSLRALTQQEPR